MQQEDINGTAVSKEQEPLVIIASNRGPFSFKQTPGGFDIKRGAGGLVTALGGIAERHDVLWIAAALSKGDIEWARQNSIQSVGDIKLRMLIPDRKRYNQYYNTVANPLLWFIQHQLWEIPRKPSITQKTWEAWREGYVAINRQFAEVIADSVQGQADTRPIVVMPQDYHLYLVPYFLRRLLGERVIIEPFVHIPWPGPDSWRILPEAMRNAIFSSLAMSDIVGFQTQKDSFNFVQTCRFYLDGAHSYGSRDTIQIQGHTVKAKAYPISIDTEKVESLMEEGQTRLLKQQLINFIGDRRLILRTDRVEPSKNILRGLEAFHTLLDLHPEYRGKVVMLALLVPSRMEVDEYKTYFRDIMAEAGLINVLFADEFWEPVRIIVGNNYQRALAAMQISDVLLVNPVLDGMNLVAKEGVLVNNRDGVLILSESAGVHYELGKYALTVSPFDIYSTAEAMHQALIMPQLERHERAEKLRELVQNNDVKRWFSAQLEDALRIFNSDSKKDSTPETPSTSTSADTPTAAGISAEPTPTPMA